MKIKYELYIIFSNSFWTLMYTFGFVAFYNLFGVVKIERLLTEKNLLITVFICLAILILSCYINIKRGRSMRAKSILKFLASRATKIPMKLAAAFFAMAYIGANPAFVVVAFPLWGFSLLPQTLRMTSIP